MGKVLLLRTCNPDMTSPSPEAMGFKWPESGFVEALDWDGGKPICGGKLHGFLWGEGRAVFANWNPDAKWLVVKADESEVLEITEDGGGKHGFRRGEVVFCGDRKGATDFILANGAAGKAVIGAVLTGGDGAVLTGGGGAMLTGGYRSTLTGGDWSTLTGGYGAVLTGGDGAVLTGGDRSTLTGGYGAVLTGGDGAVLTGGDGATLTGGYGATLLIRWFDISKSRYRIAVAEVGENGVSPNKPYRVDGGKFVEAK